ncbi:hypothetical protein N7478_009798 [Penicillium angulare]|uniref:uncharacterized protein n=1 Tax=Penicillium angulare TaxID=116970 RepID=UPI002540330E|nr:uncharacterized protein N7478_009798 [Penicillium angulare]KAJ5266990.1 hypothetical protein N7478_009798 [Penicillium angulare]
MAPPRWVQNLGARLILVILKWSFGMSDESEDESEDEIEDMNDGLGETEKGSGSNRKLPSNATGTLTREQTEKLLGLKQIRHTCRMDGEPDPFRYQNEDPRYQQDLSEFLTFLSRSCSLTNLT